MQEPYKFMFIDTTVNNTNINKHIRNGFDKLYNIEIFRE